MACILAAKREVENASHRSDKQQRKKKADLSSGSTHASLISAESIRAGMALKLCLQHSLVGCMEQHVQELAVTGT